MTKREQRVINAFINCVKHGEYSFDYACLLIEDNERYGWLSDAAKEMFYAAFEETEEAETIEETMEVEE
jgi:F420-dependent methylenetetrahydromethanopterin dehydrogenase